MKQTNNSFYELGLAPKLLEILDRLKFTIPTAIQLKTIPIALQGEDIVGIAQTGTGKTLAFGIPLIQRLAQNPGQALILAPTRELALQIKESVAVLADPYKIKMAVLMGGSPIHREQKNLAAKPRIIISTPGRLIDHLKRRNVSFTSTNILVIDEADRMFDMGFAPQIKEILGYVNKNRQTMLFSATMLKEVLTMVSVYMKRPVHIEVAPAGTMADRVTQELFVIKKEMKGKLLEKLLQQYKGTALIFTRTKFAAKRLASEINSLGHRVAQIHSDRSLFQRREALDGFKRGKYRILVATDIASRGIDVYSIQIVINYDLPQNAEDYVHRIGRTGRAGQEGHAISFATPDQKSEIRSIEAVLKVVLPIAQHPEIPLAEFPQKNKFYQFQNKSGSGGRRRFTPRRRASR